MGEQDENGRIIHASKDNDAARKARPISPGVDFAGECGLEKDRGAPKFVKILTPQMAWFDAPLGGKEKS
jgi:hypothetical protein